MFFLRAKCLLTFVSGRKSQDDQYQLATIKPNQRHSASSRLITWAVCVADCITHSSYKSPHWNYIRFITVSWLLVMAGLGIIQGRQPTVPKITVLILWLLLDNFGCNLLTCGLLEILLLETRVKRLLLIVSTYFTCLSDAAWSLLWSLWLQRLAFQTENQCHDSTTWISSYLRCLFDAVICHPFLKVDKARVGDSL